MCIGLPGVGIAKSQSTVPNHQPPRIESEPLLRVAFTAVLHAEPISTGVQRPADNHDIRDFLPSSPSQVWEAEKSTWPGKPSAVMPAGRTGFSTISKPCGSSAQPSPYGFPWFLI